MKAKSLICCLTIGGFFCIGYGYTSVLNLEKTRVRRKTGVREPIVSPVRVKSKSIVSFRTEKRNSVFFEKCGFNNLSSDGKTVDDRVSSRRGIEDALVQLFSFRTDGKHYPICLGTVIQSNSKGSLVLTSAHCVSLSPAGKAGNPLLVQKIQELGKDKKQSGVYQSFLQVAQSYLHPRFNSRHRTPLYDIALLRVPALRETSVASIYRIRPIVDGRKNGGFSLPQVTTDGEGRTRLSWQRASTSFINSLLIGIRAPNSGLCYGSSGAPVVLETEASSAIVAVVSRGVRDCKGEVMASLVSSAASGFIDQVEKNGSPRRTVQSCPECQANLAYGVGPCVTPLIRCYRDHECARVLEMLNERTDNSKENKSERIDTKDRKVAAVLRCLCHTDCRKPCGGLCGRVFK